MIPSAWQLLCQVAPGIACICGGAFLLTLAFVYACRLDYHPTQVQRDRAGAVVEPEDAGRTSRMAVRK